MEILDNLEVRVLLAADLVNATPAATAIATSVATSSAPIQYTPPTFDGRIGRIAYRNDTTATEQVTLVHPQAADRAFSTESLAPGEYSWLGTSNYGSDWGIEVDGRPVVPVGSVASWTADVDGNHFFLTVDPVNATPAATAIATSVATSSAPIQYTPPTFDGRIGRIAYRNDTTATEQVTLVHPQAADRAFSTESLAPGEYSWLGTSNYGSDWGIEVDGRPVVPVGSVASWTTDVDGNHFFRIDDSTPVSQAPPGQQNATASGTTVPGQVPATGTTPAGPSGSATTVTPTPPAHPTLVVITHGQEDSGFLPNGDGRGLQDWEDPNNLNSSNNMIANIMNNLKEPQGDTTLVQFMMVDWATRGRATGPGKEVASDIKNFLSSPDAKGLTWDILFVGHSRGTIVDNEALSNLDVANDPKIGKVMAILLDPTASALDNDLYPTGIPGPSDTSKFRERVYDDGYHVTGGAITGGAATIGVLTPVGAAAGLVTYATTVDGQKIPGADYDNFQSDLIRWSNTNVPSLHGNAATDFATDPRDPHSILVDYYQDFGRSSSLLAQDLALFESMKYPGQKVDTPVTSAEEAPVKTVTPAADLTGYRVIDVASGVVNNVVDITAHAANSAIGGTSNGAQAVVSGAANVANKVASHDPDPISGGLASGAIDATKIATNTAVQGTAALAGGAVGGVTAAAHGVVNGGAIAATSGVDATIQAGTAIGNAGSTVANAGVAAGHDIKNGNYGTATTDLAKGTLKSTVVLGKGTVKATKTLGVGALHAGASVGVGTLKGTKAVGTGVIKAGKIVGNGSVGVTKAASKGVVKAAVGAKSVGKKVLNVAKKVKFW